MLSTTGSSLLGTLSEHSIIIAGHPDKDCEKFNTKKATLFYI
jgi:hypothetical protein